MDTQKSLQDIASLDDVKKAVDEFYNRVRQDDLIGPVFEEKLHGDWPRHLDIMYRFWGTVLLEEGRSYFGNPFMQHVGLNIDQAHFDRWLHLWKETLTENFLGPVADDALLRAGKMALIFMAKLNDIRQNGGRPVF